MRKIIHLDLDAFYCAVEELQNPALKGKPFAVGGRPEERGVVASCSYAARRSGVRSAMPMGRALRLCPGLLVIPARHHLYSEVSHLVMDCLRRVTPLVEQISIDEAFLDVSELPDGPAAIAQALQAEINADLDLPCSLGIATNKLVAKIANDAGKAAAVKRLGSRAGAGSQTAGAVGDGADFHRDTHATDRKFDAPNTITVVAPGGEAAFLAPLPADRLWGVGPKTAARLAQRGIHTIGEMAACPEKELVQLFGKLGGEMAAHARGVDNAPVITAHVRKSFSQEITFARDVADERRLRQALAEMVAELSRMLHEGGFAGTTVKLKLRRPDFTTLTRQVTLPAPTRNREQILAAATTLFEKTWQHGRPLRLIGVGISGFDRRTYQLGLFDASANDPEQV